MTNNSNYNARDEAMIRAMQREYMNMAEGKAKAQLRNDAAKDKKKAAAKQKGTAKKGGWFS